MLGHGLGAAAHRRVGRSSAPHAVELIVGGSDFFDLIEKDRSQVVGHRSAESSVVLGESGVLAPLAFGKQRDGAAVVNACPHIQPLAVDPAADARGRLGDSAQRGGVLFERIGENATLICEELEKLLETLVANVFRGLGVAEPRADSAGRGAEAARPTERPTPRWVASGRRACPPEPRAGGCPRRGSQRRARMCPSRSSPSRAPAPRRGRRSFARRHG